MSDFKVHIDPQAKTSYETFFFTKATASGFMTGAVKRLAREVVDDERTVASAVAEIYRLAPDPQYYSLGLLQFYQMMHDIKGATIKKAIDILFKDMTTE